MEYRYCPCCARPLAPRAIAGDDGALSRLACTDAACGFVHWGNPTPAVGVIVEHEGEIILARNAAWPEGIFALVTGFLEAREDPKACVVREVKEELGLETVSLAPIGNYPFQQKNEVMLCYHVVTRGDVQLGAELVEYRRYKPHELRPWPRATGQAVADWMTARGLPFEYRDFPGAAAMLRSIERGEGES